MAVLIRGRHRGLPVAIDRAILLPAELKEREQHMMAMKEANNNINPLLVPLDPLTNDNQDVPTQQSHS
jgi:hypothetical protein